MPFNYRGHNVTAVVVRMYVGVCVHGNPPRGKRVRTRNVCVGVELTGTMSDKEKE